MTFVRFELNMCFIHHLSFWNIFVFPFVFISCSVGHHFIFQLNQILLMTTFVLWVQSQFEVYCVSSSCWRITVHFVYRITALMQICLVVFMAAIINMVAIVTVIFVTVMVIAMVVIVSQWTLSVLLCILFWDGCHSTSSSRIVHSWWATFLSGSWTQWNFWFLFICVSY